VVVMHRHLVVAGEIEIVARVGRASRVTQGGFDGVALHAEFDALVFTHHLGLCRVARARRIDALRAESKAADHAESDRIFQQSVHSRLSFARIRTASGSERGFINDQLDNATLATARGTDSEHVYVSSGRLPLLVRRGTCTKTHFIQKAFLNPCGAHDSIGPRLAKVISRTPVIERLQKARLDAASLSANRGGFSV